MVSGKVHVGEHAVLGLVHEGGELGQLGPELAGDPAPLRLGGFGAVLRECGRHEAETTRRLLFPAWASALRMVWTRQRCQVAFTSLATAALMPSWASETGQLDVAQAAPPQLA